MSRTRIAGRGVPSEETARRSRRRGDGRRAERSEAPQAARAQLVKDAEKMEKEKAEGEAGSKKPSVVATPGENAQVRLEPRRGPSFLRRRRWRGATRSGRAPHRRIRH